MLYILFNKMIINNEKIIVFYSSIFCDNVVLLNKMIINKEFCHSFKSTAVLFGKRKYMHYTTK